MKDSLKSLLVVRAVFIVELHVCEVYASRASYPTQENLVIGTLRNHDDDGNRNVKNNRFNEQTTIGNLSNYDGDGNKNGKNANKTLHVHHAFLYISLPSLHNYDVK